MMHSIEPALAPPSRSAWRSGHRLYNEAQPCISLLRPLRAFSSRFAIRSASRRMGLCAVPAEAVSAQVGEMHFFLPHTMTERNTQHSILFYLDCVSHLLTQPY